MWSMVYPILIILVSNIMYNICTKSASSRANPFAILAVTYAVATVTSFIMYFITAKNKNILNAFKEINWAAPLLGVVIVGLEFGYLLAYRNGWQMNRASVTANILLAVALIFVSALMYKETITARQIIGIVVCAGGLILISF